MCNNMSSPLLNFLTSFILLLSPPSSSSFPTPTLPHPSSSFFLFLLHPPLYLIPSLSLLPLIPPSVSSHPLPPPLSPFSFFVLHPPLPIPLFPSPSSFSLLQTQVETAGQHTDTRLPPAVTPMHTSVTLRASLPKVEAGCYSAADAAHHSTAAEYVRLCGGIGPHCYHSGGASVRASGGAQLEVGKSKE